MEKEVSGVLVSLIDGFVINSIVVALHESRNSYRKPKSTAGSSAQLSFLSRAQLSLTQTHVKSQLPGQKDAANNEVFNTTSCLEKPYRCPHPKIKFFLYTRRTQELGEQLNPLSPESLWNSHWNPNHPVKVIIHGQLARLSRVKSATNRLALCF
jgi:hypothetical protein